MITPKDTTVRQMLECRTEADRSRVYLVVTNLNRNLTYVIGKKLKVPGAIIKNGTKYYKSFNEAYTIFTKIRDCISDKKKEDGIWISS